MPVSSLLHSGQTLPNGGVCVVWQLTLDLERKGTVRVDLDNGRRGDADLEVGRLCVELLGEIHGFDTLGTKRRSDRRLSGSLACGDDQLDERSCCSNGCLSSLFRHDTIERCRSVRRRDGFD